MAKSGFFLVPTPGNEGVVASEKGLVLGDEVGRRSSDLYGIGPPRWLSAKVVGRFEPGKDLCKRFSGEAGEAFDAVVQGDPSVARSVPCRR